MCGILGQIAFSSRGRPVQREEISPRLIALMARRGPDDEGLWSDGDQCILAFRRLAILRSIGKRASANAHARCALCTRVQRRGLQLP